jgi:hypothetical protein
MESRLNGAERKNNSLTAKEILFANADLTGESSLRKDKGGTMDDFLLTSIL